MVLLLFARPNRWYLKGSRTPQGCVHDTDISGQETIVGVAGAMKVNTDRNVSSSEAATLVAQDVAARCKELVIVVLRIRVRAAGAPKTRTRGPGAQAALRALARAGHVRTH